MTASNGETGLKPAAMEGKFHILWRFIVDILVCTKADKSEGRGKDVKRKKKEKKGAHNSVACVFAAA